MLRFGSQNFLSKSEKTAHRLENVQQIVKKLGCFKLSYYSSTISVSTVEIVVKGNLINI